MVFSFDKNYGGSHNIYMSNLIKASKDILALRKNELSEKRLQFGQPLSPDQNYVLK